jgi:hypothetical protein
MSLEGDVLGTFEWVDNLCRESIMADSTSSMLESLLLLLTYLFDFNSTD